MSLYATVDEIRENRPKSRTLFDATDEDILRWLTEACIEIDAHCEQDFVFEQQVTKRLAVTLHQDVKTPKIYQNVTKIEAAYPGGTPFSVDLDTEVELTDGTNDIRYIPRNTSTVDTSLLYLYVTADWGFPLTELELLINLANSLKSLYTTHIASTDYHLAADSTNTIAAADATSLASVYTLLNEMKTDLTAHVLSTTFHSEATVLSLPANASTQDTALTLALAIQDAYDTHVVNTDAHLEADEAVTTISTSISLFPDRLKQVVYNVTQRVAIRDNHDDLRYHNAGFSQESWGDEYRYTMGTDLRAYLSARDLSYLAPYVNYGKQVF